MIAVICFVTFLGGCDKEKESWEYDVPEFDVKGILEFTKYGEQKQITITNVKGTFTVVAFDDNDDDSKYFQVNPFSWKARSQTITIKYAPKNGEWGREGFLRFRCRYGNENNPWFTYIGVPYHIYD